MAGNMTQDCKLGDVIRSVRFAQGERSEYRAPVLVGKSGNADDATRTEASFVVVEVLRGNFDVMARRLAYDDDYDPVGEVIYFFQRKMRPGPVIKPEEIERIGVMHQVFVWDLNPPARLSIQDEPAD